MSKKSRRRNKKILATLAALGGAAMLANRRRDNSIAANEAKEAGFGTENDFKETIVTTPKVYQDSIMRGGKGVKASTIRNPKSTFIESDGSISRGDVPTGKKVGIDTKGIFVNKKGNITAGGKQFYDKNQYRTRNDKPGMLGDSGFSLKPSMRSMSGLADGDFAAKKGGRATKSGFKRKGAAKRGFGRAFKGGK
jgi:hypothetical protein